MTTLLDQLIGRITAADQGRLAELHELAQSATKALRWVPNPGPQTQAYFSPADELFYGGQAGGGKSDLILGLAVNEHTISRIFRRQHNDRQALIDRMTQILGTRDGYNGSDHVWRVPETDKVIRFGAMSDPSAWERYQGDATDLKAWDELTQFRETEYRTVNAWLRTTKPKQRTRIISAGNPPVTPEGLWVVQYWGAWLDPRHPKPAKPGELRWYTSIGGEDVEVDKDWRGTDGNGAVILPKSRTFVPATLTDNPDLAETDYASTLASLPAHLRAALAEGKFQAALEDDAMQVIPTEWILAAQQRWQAQIAPGRMTSLGVDVAQGGPDETVLAALHGAWFAEPVVKRGIDTKNGRAVAALCFEVQRDDCQINIDCTGGWGLGALEHLQSNGMPVVACVASHGSTALCRDKKLGFVNKRAEWWWKFREALDPDRGDNVCLPPGRRIVAELASARYRLTSRTMIQIEAKDEIIKRIGMSPNIADALILAWAEADQPLRAVRPSSLRSAQGRRSPPITRQYGKVVGKN
jgi:hypothetical protein